MVGLGRRGPASSDLQQSKINIHQSAILPPTTPMATSGRTAAGQPYLPFFCSKSSSYFRVRSRDSRFNFFLTPMATSGRTAAGQPYLFDFNNQKSTFINHQFFLSLYSPSRRWRQVGGPQRVSPTSSTDHRLLHFRSQVSGLSFSSTYHADGDKWADHGGSALPVALSRKHYFVMVKW
jgi:hypothetical protein